MRFSAATVCTSQPSVWLFCGRCPADRTALRTTSRRSCGRDRRHLTPGGVRRPRGPHRQGPSPAHPARRVAGPLRGPRGGQPPPPDLPDLRRDGRCRLCGGRHPVPDGRRRLGLRSRRSRGHLLGPMPRVCRRDSASSRRLKCDTQRVKPAGRPAFDPEQPTSRAMSHQKETAKEETDRRV